MVHYCFYSSKDVPLLSSKCHVIDPQIAETIYPTLNQPSWNLIRFYPTNV